MNLLEGVFKSATAPRLPLHAGEAFTLWVMFVGITESRVICQLLTNHTNDNDLKETIEHFVNEVQEPLIKKLEHLLAHEGVGLPAVTGEKPRANESDIPPGAKFTDIEIANLLAVKIEGMLNICNFGIAQALRDDVGAMLLMTYQHIAAQGFTLKKTMQERGWLRYPPVFPFRPELAEKA